MLKRFLRISVSFLLVLVLACLFSHGVAIIRGADEASPSVAEADVAVRRAFNATLDAERAGANVSGLIVKLDEAGGLLAEAENAYKVGNFSEAVSKAEECSMLADGVIGEALSLKTMALADAQTAFWQNLTFSCVGGAAFLVVLFLVWGWFKRVYAEKLLKMKPEVASDVEA
jgi:hypothetical protein